MNTWGDTYRFWTGTDWLCWGCDKPAEPWEDTNLCRDCVWEGTLI